MTDSQVEKEIDSVEQELIDAARRQDAAALDRIIADDFLITSDTIADKLGDKKLYLAECLASGTIEAASASYDKVKVRVYGNTAIVNSIFKYQVTIAGEEHGGVFLSTKVWVKNGEQWQFVACHSHRLPEAAL
jgi:ketosteroid isomerase-like protein